MRKSDYAKLWTAVGIVVCFISLNAWIASQGGRPMFSQGIIEERLVLSALLAIPFVAILLALEAEIGIRHARRSRRTVWHGRLPVVWLTGLNTSSREGQLYQGFFLFAFILIPLAALVHFVDESFEAVVLHRASGAVGTLRHPPGGEGFWGFGDDFRIGTHAVASDMVTWWPVWGPVIFGLLILLAIWRVAVLIVAIFRPSAQVLESISTGP